MNFLDALNVYPHNRISYVKIKNAFLHGENIVGIIHATGTGKSFNALLLALENKDKKVLYLSPYKAINKHVKKIIRDNNLLNMEDNLPKLSFKTFTGLIEMTDEEIISLDVDYLIIDEFHHLGAPVWSAKIDLLIRTHPNIKILGMTAYPIRDRGSIYERDMAPSGGDELFSDHIYSYYSLADALIDEVLPEFTYYTNFNITDEAFNALEAKVDSAKLPNINKENLLDMLNDAKKMVHKAPGTRELIRNNVFLDGKYIYFCPFKNEENKNDINTIKKEIRTYFPELSDDEIIFYTTTSSMGKVGFDNQKAFEDDLTLDGKDASGKLRIMLAINQYNEGVHTKGVDGVIMGRNTTSEMVFFEQLGRALAVKGENNSRRNKLSLLSLESLKLLANQRGISKYSSKDDLIEKLLRPVIIDLTNNIDYIASLENKIGTHVKERREDSLKTGMKFHVKDSYISVNVQNIDIHNILAYVRDRLISTWEDWYELASNYYNYYHNLDIPYDFKTLEGTYYDENGKALGQWLSNQKRKYHQGDLSDDRIKLLEKLDISFKSKIFDWQDFYELLIIYKNHYSTLDIPSSFKTIDGINKDENGHDLGRWLQTQKQKYNEHTLEDFKITKLQDIGYTFSKKINTWYDNFFLAKKYSEYHNDLNVSVGFKTLDGINFDENGKNLHEWLHYQKKSYHKGTLGNDKIKLLESIGFDFAKSQKTWPEAFIEAKSFYDTYSHLEIPESYVTESGFSLGNWISRQRTAYNKGLLDDAKANLLLSIGMRFDYLKFNTWEETYNLAENYYLLYGNAAPSSYVTEDGYKLGAWVNWQKQLIREGKLSKEQVNLLSKIGISIIENDIKR